VKTPYVYCAMCAVPLGTGRQRDIYFCGDYCKLFWPGRKLYYMTDRDEVVRFLFHGAQYDTSELGSLYGRSRQAMEAIIKGK